MNRYAEVEPALPDSDMVFDDDNGAPPPLTHSGEGYDTSRLMV